MPTCPDTHPSPYSATWCDDLNIDPTFEMEHNYCRAVFLSEKDDCATGDNVVRAYPREIDRATGDWAVIR